MLDRQDLWYIEYEFRNRESFLTTYNLKYGSFINAYASTKDLNQQASAIVDIIQDVQKETREEIAWAKKEIISEIDLKRVATKEDILAVKEDILAVKEDILGVIEKLETNISDKYATKLDLEKTKTQLIWWMIGICGVWIPFIVGILCKHIGA